MPALDSGRTDAELLAAHVAGDQRAFAELVNRHRDRLWAVALRTMRDPEEAADALQDAFISAFRGAARFRAESAVTTWLHRIVVNACLDRIRRRQSRPTSPLPEEGPGEPADPRDAHADRELAMDIEDALATLPEEQRAAIVLVDVEGYPVSDAAVALGVAEGTIKSRCARGRAKLAVLLGHLRNPDAAPDVEPSIAAPGGRPTRARWPRGGGGGTRQRKRAGMSMEPGVRGTPVGPPWSVDDVADVQAGLYPPEVTADLRARIADDPDGAAILAALDSTVDDLSLLPPLVIPAQYALRIDQAISAEIHARAEARTTQVVKGGFGALLNPAAAAAPQPGLPTLTAAPTRVPPQRARPARAEPGNPPPRHPPLIPRVLPGAAQYQPPRTPQPERPTGGPPPYAPADRGQAPPYGSGGPGPGGPAPGGPGSGPGRAGGSTGRGPTGDRPRAISSLDAARAKRRRRVGGGLLAAAAVAAVVIVGVIGLRSNDGGSGGANVALPAATVSSTTTVPAGGGSAGGQLQAFTIEPGKFDEAFAKLNGIKEGKLTELPVFTACLAANKITGTDVLGVSDVTYEQKSAMAIAVAIPGNTTQATVLVVGAGCGPDGPELLAQETVTR